MSTADLVVVPDVAEDAGGRPGRLRRFAPPAVPAAALAIVLVLQVWNAPGIPYPNDDEGAYLSQAWAIWHGSLANYTYWYDHPPFGWIQLALLDWLPRLFLPDASALTVGRYTMTAITGVTLTCVYLVSRRLGAPRWIATLTLLLAGLSPLALALHRQIYLDNFATMWLLIAFTLALSPRRSLWMHTLAGAATAGAVLSKETIAVAIPALVVALWQGSHSDTRRFSYAGYLSGLVLTISIYPLWAVLKGELFPGDGHVSLLGTLKFQLMDRAGTGSVFSAGTEAHELLTSWLSDDPVLLYAGAGAALAGLLVRQARPASVAALIFLLVALRPSGYLPKMYVIQILPFFALAIGGVLAALLADRRRLVRLPAYLSAGALVAWAYPVWTAGGGDLLHQQTNGGYKAAAEYIRTELHPRPGDRIVVDGVLWLDAVKAGYTPGTGAIWHYKLDLDPAIKPPYGWRELDYIVSTPAIRGEASNPAMPLLGLALGNSTIVKSFGDIEIRRITP